MLIAPLFSDIFNLSTDSQILLFYWRLQPGMYNDILYKSETTLFTIRFRTVFMSSGNWLHFSIILDEEDQEIQETVLDLMTSLASNTRRGKYKSSCSAIARNLKA